MSVKPSGTRISPSEFAGRLAELVEMLEAVVHDRSVMTELSSEERTRFLRAVAAVYSPDRAERRRLSKVKARERRAHRSRADDGMKHETGIRALRRKPIFHSPNVFPPPGG